MASIHTSGFGPIFLASSLYLRDLANFQSSMFQKGPAMVGLTADRSGYRLERI